MNYTILELERIEKILQEKRAAANDAYNRQVTLVQEKFRTDQLKRTGRRSDIIFSGPAVGYIGEPVSKVLSKAWQKFQLEDKDLALVKAEFDLFQKGIDTLKSYWNSSVDIFINNLKEKSHEQI